MEIILNIPEDEKKYKIEFFDKGTKFIVNEEGKKKIIRTKEGETYKSALERMKINSNNFYFLKQGSMLQGEDLQKRISIKGEKEVHLLAYKTDGFSDENDDEITPNQNGENKEQILDYKNEKIYKPKESIIVENEDKDISRGSKGSLYGRDKRNFIIKSNLVLIAELCAIMLFLWIGVIYGMNKPFIKSVSSILGTFIPIVLVLSLMSPVPIFFKGSEMNWLISSIYIIIYIPSIIFLCFLLTNFTNLRCIIEVLFLFYFDFVVTEIYLFIFDSLSIWWMIIPHSISNAIVINVNYFLWGHSIREVINISIIAFVFILYLLVCICWIKDYNNYVQRAIATSYGIFFPLGILLYSIANGKEFFSQFFGCKCCDHCYDCCEYCDF